MNDTSNLSLQLLYQQSQSVVWIPILLIIFILVFVYAIPWISYQVTLIGLYHSNNRESQHERRRKVITSYGLLSIPILASYIFILRSLSIPLNIYTSLLILTATMATMVITRLHSNPTKDDMQDIFTLFSKDDRKELIEQHRERYLSFLFSMVVGQMIIAYFAFGYSTTKGTSFNFVVGTPAAILFIFAYALSLWIITYFGEKHLEKNPPIHQLK